MMTNEEQDEAGGNLKSYVEDKLNEAGFKDVEVNDKGEIIGDRYIIYTDSAKKTAPIPNGFTVSTLPGETTIAGGLVIYEGTEPVTNVDSDSNGIIDAQETRNQFVWVPVDDIDEFVTKDGYYDEVLQTKVLNGEVIEPFKTDAYIEEETEYNSMKASVEENKGFYIGRYEAGTTTEREYETDNGTTPLVVQKDKVVYNYVCWGQSMTDTTGEVEEYYGYNQGLGAVELSRNMYKNSLSVVSTLCYGVQWDAALRFISTNSQYVDFAKDSWKKGNYGDNLETTGYYATNNIYDMAGNVYEWTMEAISTDKRVLRGGAYNVDSKFSASYRSVGLEPNTTAVIQDGFRTTLYIK